jgi:hypothetical protein
VDIKVIAKTREDLNWDFGDGPPSIVLNHASVRVDPFPGYSHDLEKVEHEVDRLRVMFPITWPVTFYLLPYEFLERTNAYAQASAFDYSTKIEAPDGEEQYARDPYIVLSGKRIPIMPAMTRYLVSHEYGHVVEDWIAKQRGQNDQEMLAEYAKMRGLTENPKSYGGGWHLTPGEIFANDFRILVMGTEIEFWPHPVSRPEQAPRSILDFWHGAMKLVNSL